MTQKEQGNEARNIQKYRDRKQGTEGLQSPKTAEKVAGALEYQTIRTIAHDKILAIQNYIQGLGAYELLKIRG